MENISPELMKIIQQEATRAAEAVYLKYGSQYGVAKVPAHTHNNIDSGNIPPISVTGFYPLSAQVGGIVAPTTLGNQVVTQGNTSRGYGRFDSVSQGSFVTYPTIIIYGNGGGVDSQFNGGDAPEGTMVFFNNGATISGLWIRSGGSWFGIGQTSMSYGNRII